MNDVAANPPPVRPDRTLLERLARAARSEFGLLVAEPRQTLVQMAALPLPQLSFNRTRTALLRAGGMRIGRGSQVMGPLTITGPGRWDLVEIGEDSFVTGPLRLDLGQKVTIGNRVNIGLACTILTIDHRIGPREKRCGYSVTGPVTIEDGVWLGANVTILPGVTVGEASVVAAGAVVTRDVPPNTLVAGIPARMIRDLSEDAPLSSRRRDSLGPPVIDGFDNLSGLGT